MNQLICLQSVHYYANGFGDGAALTRAMVEEKQDVTINITVM